MYLVAQNSTNFVSRMQSLKQTVKILGKDNVVLDLQMMDCDEVLNITECAISFADASGSSRNGRRKPQTMMIHQLTRILFNQLLYQQKFTLVLQVQITHQQKNGLTELLNF